jgi:Leucine-rich repeat (LRR) protein
LPKLEVLALAKNQFRGPLPATFDTAPSLKAVSLQDQVSKGGGLSGEVPSYSTSRTLCNLMLGKNKLEGELPEDFLTAVEEDVLFRVDLSNNDLTGTIHGSFERFKKMDLYLEGNRIAEIDQGLCNNDDWMSGTVASFGCDAILCPAGTAGGRRQFTDDMCQPCGESSLNEDGTSSFLGQTSCAKASSTTGEREILELFYNRMGGVGWKASNYWMTDESICNWYGVDCDENGYIASIQLGSNQLVGSFPTEIYQLKSLVHLKLYANSIYMNFEGISNADNLQTLSLDSTGLESLEGVGQARSLTELIVGHNKLSGSLPEELSRLINLRTLDVSHNTLGGSLPVWLRGLVSLTTFAASHNTFSGPVSDFASLSTLVYLDLSFNELSGTIPPTLLAGAPVDEKIVVDLTHNKIDGTVPADLSRLSRLSLQLQDNRISEIDPQLCATEGINDFDTLSFGCNGILCPAGSWNPLGRQSNEDVACEPCDKAEFMGATHCGKSDASMTKPGAIMVTLAALGGGVVLFELLL